jgi:hypothetical protein
LTSFRVTNSVMLTTSTSRLAFASASSVPSPAARRRTYSTRASRPRHRRAIPSRSCGMPSSRRSITSDLVYELVLFEGHVRADPSTPRRFARPHRRGGAEPVRPVAGPTRRR